MKRSWRWCALVDGTLAYTQTAPTTGKVIDSSSITTVKAAAERVNGQAVRVLVIS